jgi:hypothetical protein
VPTQRIGEIVAGRRATMAVIDLRLCRFFGLSSSYWLRAQAAHDTEVAERTLAKVLWRVRPWAERPRASPAASQLGCAWRSRRHRGTIQFLLPESVL